MVSFSEAGAAAVTATSAYRHHGGSTGEAGAGAHGLVSGAVAAR